VLSDFWPHGEISKAYGTFEESRGCPKRGTFVIGRDGNIKWMVVNGLGDARNIAEYKAALSAL
jgi:alkyl hydroperoxide reductase subunit AhpC